MLLKSVILAASIIAISVSKPPKYPGHEVVTSRPHISPRKPPSHEVQPYVVSKSTVKRPSNQPKKSPTNQPRKQAPKQPPNTSIIQYAPINPIKGAQDKEAQLALQSHNVQSQKNNTHFAEHPDIVLNVEDMARRPNYLVQFGYKHDKGVPQPIDIQEHDGETNPLRDPRTQNIGYKHRRIWESENKPLYEDLKFKNKASAISKVNSDSSSYGQNVLRPVKHVNVARSYGLVLTYHPPNTNEEIKRKNALSLTPAYLRVEQNITNKHRNIWEKENRQIYEVIKDQNKGSKVNRGSAPFKKSKLHPVKHVNVARPYNLVLTYHPLAENVEVKRIKSSNVTLANLQTEQDIGYKHQRKLDSESKPLYDDLITREKGKAFSKVHKYTARYGQNILRPVKHVNVARLYSLLLTYHPSRDNKV